MVIFPAVSRYRKSGVADSLRADTSSFYLILDLINFFDLYHEGQMEEALEVSERNVDVCISPQEYQSQLVTKSERQCEISSCNFIHCIR